MRRKNNKIANENIAVKTDVYHNTSADVVNVTAVINKLSLKTINDLAKNIPDIKRVEWNGNSQYSIIAYNEKAADELIKALNATESRQRRVAKESWLSTMEYDENGAKWELQDGKDINDFIRALTLFQEQNPRFEIEFDGTQLTMDSSKVVAQEFETEFNAMERRLQKSMLKYAKLAKETYEGKRLTITIDQSIIQYLDRNTMLMYDLNTLLGRKCKAFVRDSYRSYDLSQTFYQVTIWLSDDEVREITIRDKWFEELIASGNIAFESKTMSLEAMKFIGDAEDNLGYKFAKKYTLGNLTDAAINRVFTKLNQEDNDAGFELEDDTITILADDKSQFDRAYSLLFAASEKRRVAKESINLQEGSKVILKVTKDFVKQLSQVDDSELFDKFADKFVGKHVNAEVLGSYTTQNKSYVTLNVFFDDDYDLEIDLDYTYFNALVDAGTVSFESKRAKAAKENRVPFYLTLTNSATVTTSKGHEIISRTYRTDDTYGFADFIEKNSESIWIENVTSDKVEVRAYDASDIDDDFKKFNIGVERRNRRTKVAKENLTYVADYDVFDRFEIQKEYTTDLPKGKIIQVMRYLDDEGFVFDIDILDDSIVVMADDQSTFDIVIDKLNEA